MAHFAKLDENNIVICVNVVDNENAPGEFPESETAGRAYLAAHGFSGTWVQTSYNNKFRKRYAGIGCTYDPVNDVFISPQPHPGFTLNENFDWVPPIPYPSEGNWYWDTVTQNWVENGD